MKLLIAIPVGHVFKLRGNPNVARNYLKFFYFFKMFGGNCCIVVVDFFLVFAFHISYPENAVF